MFVVSDFSRKNRSGPPDSRAVVRDQAHRPTYPQTKVKNPQALPLGHVRRHPGGEIARRAALPYAAAMYPDPIQATRR
jgi:hypothetical protein